MIHLFWCTAPQVEVMALKRLDAQANNINKVENTSKNMWLRVNLLTEKVNRSREN